MRQQVRQRRIGPQQIEAVRVDHQRHRHGNGLQQLRLGRIIGPGLGALTHELLAGNSAIPLLRALGAFTPLANLCDLPSIAVPMGVDDRGRPLSIMFIGAPGSETELLRIAHAVEATQLGTARI